MTVASSAKPTSEANHDCALIRAVVKREDGYWAAVAIDYTVTGTGATPEDAKRDLLAALEDYLEWCRKDGLTPAQARRPISRKWRLQLEAAIQLAKVRGRLHRGRQETREIDIPVSWAC